MPAVALAYPMGYLHNGILYLVGYRGGKQYLRRSGDGGASWLRWSDDSQEKEIAASDAERVAFVKLETQGGRLVVGVPQAPYIAVYLSRDDGATWRFEGLVGE